MDRRTVCPRAGGVTDHENDGEDRKDCKEDESCCHFHARTYFCYGIGWTRGHGISLMRGLYVPWKTRPA